MRTIERPSPTLADFAMVTLACTWSGPVGLSPAGCAAWRVRLERRAVDSFRERATKNWPGVRIEEEEEVDSLS